MMYNERYMYRTTASKWIGSEKFEPAFSIKNIYYIL